MAQRAIREYDAKRMLSAHWTEYFGKASRYEGNVVLVTAETALSDLGDQYPWLNQKKLIVKPDQLFGRRGKHGLVLLDADLDRAVQWIGEHMGKEVTLDGITDRLTHFLVEEHVPHREEYFLAIKSERDSDQILFSAHGGMDIEKLWSTVTAISIPILEEIEAVAVDSRLPPELGEEKKRGLSPFIRGLFKFYRDLHFTYLEINPFALAGEQIMPLDFVARLDDTAHFACAGAWGDVSFPPPFGRKLSAEEAYIKQLDQKSGASMKLTVFNPKGRVWTLVAGGGASVIYADTIADLGFGKELANYGEYSGNPSADETYEYVKTVLSLMVREKDPDGKILLIGGGIANFTDVNATFTGIVKAIREFSRELIDGKVTVYVRRGGPNYRLGLENMKKLGVSLGLPIHVYGPELHMTRIVRYALQKGEVHHASK